MEQALRRFDRILVTGPQRSGTTFIAKTIAYDIGLEFIPEEAFGVHDVARFFALYATRTGFVVQAPTMCFVCHYVPGAVVMCKRNVADILASQERIGWTRINEPIEYTRYFKDDYTLPIAVHKYVMWEKWQKPMLGARSFEIEYESLRGHPLWVPKEQRVNFKPRQTAL